MAMEKTMAVVAATEMMVQTTGIAMAMAMMAVAMMAVTMAVAAVVVAVAMAVTMAGWRFKKCSHPKRA